MERAASSAVSCDAGRHRVVASRRFAAEVGVQRGGSELLLGGDQLAALDALRQRQDVLLQPVQVGAEQRPAAGEIGRRAALPRLGGAFAVGQFVADRQEQHEVGVEPIEVVAQQGEGVAPVPTGDRGIDADQVAVALVAKRRRQRVLELLRERLRVGDARTECHRVAEDDDAARGGCGARPAALAQAERIGGGGRAVRGDGGVPPQHVADARIDVAAERSRERRGGANHVRTDRPVHRAWTPATSTASSRGSATSMSRDFIRSLLHRSAPTTARAARARACVAAPPEALPAPAPVPAPRGRPDGARRSGRATSPPAAVAPPA